MNHFAVHFVRLCKTIETVLRALVGRIQMECRIKMEISVNTQWDFVRFTPAKKQILSHPVCGYCCCRWWPQRYFCGSPFRMICVSFVESIIFIAAEKKNPNTLSYREREVCRDDVWVRHTNITLFICRLSTLHLVRTFEQIRKQNWIYADVGLWWRKSKEVGRSGERSRIQHIAMDLHWLFSLSFGAKFDCELLDFQFHSFHLRMRCIESGAANWFKLFPRSHVLQRFFNWLRNLEKWQHFVPIVDNCTHRRFCFTLQPKSKWLQ